jgi:hypothetical protein
MLTKAGAKLLDCGRAKTAQPAATTDAEGLGSLRRAAGHDPVFRRLRSRPTVLEPACGNTPPSQESVSKPWGMGEAWQTTTPFP